MPRNSNRTIKATFILFALLLSALAFLAGCKPSQSKTGYLYVDANAVQFVRWEREGMQIKGDIEIWARTPGGKVEFTMLMFDGVLDGETVGMTLTSSWTLQGSDKKLVAKEIDGKIPGMLKGDTLTLLLVDESEPKEFHRATAAEHAEARRNLRMRATSSKEA